MFAVAPGAQKDGMNWRGLGVQLFLPEGTRMGKESPLPVSSLLRLIDSNLLPSAQAHRLHPFLSPLPVGLCVTLRWRMFPPCVRF